MFYGNMMGDLRRPGGLNTLELMRTHANRQRAYNLRKRVENASRVTINPNKMKGI